MPNIIFIFRESRKDILDKKQVSSLLFWPVLHNYTRERIVIGSVFMQNYYQCPSEAAEKRRVGRGTRRMGSISVSPGSIYTWVRTANKASVASPHCKTIDRKVLHIELIQNVNLSKTLWDKGTLC